MVLKPRLAGVLLGNLLKLWRLTVRLEIRGGELLDQLVGAPIALWHGRMQGAGMALRKWRIASLASASADGELATGCFEALGYRIARGSSSKGGKEGLARLSEWIAEGRVDHVALTVDGPRGPAMKVKPGVVYLAKQSGKPVLPITFSATRFWVLNSWDRMVLAKPFSRVVVKVGPPVEIPAEVGMKEACRLLGEAMRAQTRSLDMEVAGYPIWEER